ERLGGKKTIELDVRVIATSNRNLMKEVQEGRFREDLYYRLNVFPIQCLSLKERPLDIVPIAEYFLSRHGATTGGNVPTLSKAAEQRLKSYSWPGNVRELENVVQRALILHTGDFIELADLQLDVGLVTTESSTPSKSTAKLGEGVQNHEFQLILEALDKYRGNRTKVAESLGVSPRTLRYKLAKMRDAGISI
ncbi:MAG: sigma 54-interacting transcriptional regulator, partial [Gammaproteobacteria bacterium]